MRTDVWRLEFDEKMGRSVRGRRSVAWWSEAKPKCEDVAPPFVFSELSVSGAVCPGSAPSETPPI